MRSPGLSGGPIWSIGSSARKMRPSGAQQTTEQYLTVGYSAITSTFQSGEVLFGPWADARGGAAKTTSTTDQNRITESPWEEETWSQFVLPLFSFPNSCLGT